MSERFVSGINLEPPKKPIVFEEHFKTTTFQTDFDGYELIPDDSFEQCKGKILILDTIKSFESSGELGRGEVKSLSFPVKESGIYKLNMKNMNTLAVLKQSFSVKYTCGNIFKGEIEDLIPGKSWIKTFKFKEEQIPCTFKFEINSHCLFGTVNYDLGIFQDFEKLKEEYGTLTHKDSQILLKVNHGIYRVFIENKSKLIGQNLQFDIESTSSTVQDKVLQVGDKCYTSNAIVVLTKQEPMKLTINLKPLVKGNERIHVDYGVIISREYDSKKIIKESEKRINFRASFTQAIQDKNLNQITSLFKDPLLKDKQFLESMNQLFNKAMELYHEANETVRNIKESIKLNSIEDIQKSLEPLKDYNPSYFEHLETAQKEANSALQNLFDKKKCYEEFEAITTKEAHFSIYEEIQKIKKNYKEKLQDFFEPMTEHEKLIYEKVEKLQKEAEEHYLKEKERKRKEIDLIMNLETLIVLDNVENIETFLLENKDNLPKEEYQKGQEQLKEIKERKEEERIEEMKKDKILYQAYLDEKLRKYQMEKDAEEREKRRIEDEKRMEQMRILELQKKEIEMKKEEERKQKEKRDAEEREKREVEEKLRREKVRKEREEKEKKEKEERERLEAEKKQKLVEEALEKPKQEETTEKLMVTSTIKKALSSYNIETSPATKKVVSPGDSPKSTSEKRRSNSFVLDPEKKEILQKTHSYSLLPEKDKDSPDTKQSPGSVVPLHSPILSPRSSSKLPKVLDNLHKSTITIIRMASLQNDPNYVVRKIFPFVEDIDIIVDSLMEILETNRSVSYFFKIPTNPMEIAKKINSKAVQEFHAHHSYKSFQKETQKFITEVKMFVQYLLHFGLQTQFYQTLISDQKYASSVYTPNSIVRNEQFKDEMIITIDLLGQIKFKFDTFLDPNEVIKVDNNITPIIKDLPLSEPISVSVKKSKKKKVHQNSITNIKSSSNDIVEYFISEAKNKNMNEIGESEEVTKMTHKLIGYLILALKNGIMDDNLDLWTTLTIVVNAASKDDTPTKKALVKTFDHMEKDMDSDTKVYVFFSLLTNESKLSQALEEISNSSQLDTFYKGTSLIKTKVSIEKIISFLKKLDKLPLKIKLIPETEFLPTD